MIFYNNSPLLGAKMMFFEITAPYLGQKWCFKITALAWEGNDV